MSSLTLIESVAAGAGVGTSLVLLLSNRLGPGSRFLAASLAPLALACAVLAAARSLRGWSDEHAALAAYSLLVLAAPGGLFFSLTFARGDHRKDLARWKWVLALASVAAPLLVAALHAWPTKVEDLLPVNRDVPLGPGGYFSAIYLLVVSVLVLANLERTLRGAEEHVLWEIKFAALGVAAPFATCIYLASKILLYSVPVSFLPLDTLQAFSFIYLLSSILILVSWRRISHQRIVVSQGLLYSSITFLAVGVYLIASAFVAQWSGSVVQSRVEAEVVVFALLVMVLGVVVLSARFRHRLRHWVRRNVYAGRYDYRAFWIEATERLRATDSPEVAGAALAEIIHDALGAINVSVWCRSKSSSRLRRLAARGPRAAELPSEGPEWFARLSALEEPAGVAEVATLTGERPDAGLLEVTEASLFVPLRSGGEVIGFLTVGPDRSGRAFDFEAREFLRVLAGHAAGELHKAELLAGLVEAKEAEAFRSFSTFLLHDLKNFASTLSLVAENAVHHAKNPDFQRDAFQSIYDTAEKMKRLCNSLRSFSRTLAGNRRREDLNRVVQEVGMRFSALGSRLSLQLGQVSPVVIDVEEMAAVIQNLILNAEQAITSEGAIKVRTEAVDGTVRLVVEDNGEGISEEFLRHELFLPFRTTKTGGLGIGLFQSRRIVEAHGGRMDVTSAEGKGTTVVVELPVEMTED